MKQLIIFSILFVNSLFGYSQTDAKLVVGVAEFSSEVDSKYAKAVAEKIVQIVTNTKRFTVVDRTSYEKVKQELELQKTEAFLDSKNTVKQDAVLAAEYMIIGHILKMSVYAMKNPDGSINGYKASTAFTLKVNQVETNKTTEAESFQTEVSPLMLSPESAVNEALKSIELSVSSYFGKTFPLVTKISKILIAKKEKAVTVLIAAGKDAGLKENDKLVVERIEIIEGKPYPSVIGELKVSKIAGTDFSECTVESGGAAILEHFNSSQKLSCKLIVK
ncbi:MAG TPA: penicillin-binding protein activator LpoB [Bacteroidales bacterium]|nr:penicillin-binding protein activator LpoB [Bacteroidales bacterium]